MFKLFKIAPLTVTIVSGYSLEVNTHLNRKKNSTFSNYKNPDYFLSFGDPALHPKEKLTTTKLIFCRDYRS